MLTKRKKAFIKALPTAKSNTEAAIIAGYSPKTASQKAYQLMNEKAVRSRIDELGEVGLNTLEDVAVNGKVESARVQAGKTLVETAYGKPKDNPSNRVGDVTININKIVSSDIEKLMGASVKHTQSRPLLD